MYKKNVKQILSIVMLFITIVSTIPLDVFAIDDGFIFEDPDETILVGYKGNATEITIPNGVKVIKTKAFKDKKIEKIKLNDGLEEIDTEAFANNKINGSITFPLSLKIIGQNAFSDNLIESVDFSKTDNLEIGPSAFQDNKIAGKIDLDTIENIPIKAFWGNKIRDIAFSNKLNTIGNEAFANNKLSNLSIPERAELGKDVFAGNGRYVIVKSDVLKSDKSEYHNYGHIVNPIDIEVRYLEEIYDDEVPTGNYKAIKSNERLKFDPYNEDGYFTLNENSQLIPGEIINYTIDETKHKDGVVSFTPNKNNYIVNVYFKKIPQPQIVTNEEALKELIDNKKEEDDVSEEELLSLVSASDYKGSDISKNIKAFPTSIINAEAKEYEITYSVKDNEGRTAEYKLILPIAIDPMKIKIANTEWQLEDFVYDKDTVLDLSDKGKQKASIIPGVAIPHINPHTFESIKEIRFLGKYGSSSNLSGYIKEGELVFGDPDSIEVIGKFSFGGVPINSQLPNMPNLIKVEDLAFVGSKITGTFPNYPRLKSVGLSAFAGCGLTGAFPELPELEEVGVNAFGSIEITSFPEIFPKLKHIRIAGFRGLDNIEGGLPQMPELESIGHRAFEDFAGQGIVPPYPKLERIDKEAFRGSKITGLSNMHNLKYVGESAFDNCYYLKGAFPNIPNIEVIEDRAFRYVEFDRYSGLPDMPKLKHLGLAAFSGTNITGEFPNIDSIEFIGIAPFSLTDLYGGSLENITNVKYISDGAFDDVKLKGSLPDMPELTHIGHSAFINTGISGEFPNIPNVDYIGNDAFQGTKISGSLPHMPGIRYFGNSAFKNLDMDGVLKDVSLLEYIGDEAFRNTNIKGSLPEMPNLKNIGAYAFGNTNIEGELPELSRLKKLGNYAFYNTSIKRSDSIYIDNDIEIAQNAFVLSRDDNGDNPQVLLTQDGKDAPKVAKSKHHVLNPYTVQLTGVDTQNNELIKKSILAVEDGDNIKLFIPKIKGFYSEEYITIAKIDLVEDSYVYVYKTDEEHLNEHGGNQYQFNFTSTQTEELKDSNESIESFISLSTVNENSLQNGEIRIRYDNRIYRDFFIPKSKGIDSVRYYQGDIQIILDKSIPIGTEIKVPVVFKFNPGALPEKNLRINANLYQVKNDISTLKGSKSLAFKPKIDTPVYLSTFFNDKKQTYENILVDDTGSDYSTVVRIYPQILNFIRDVKDLSVSYDVVYFKNKYGVNSKATLTKGSERNGWEEKDGQYIYRIQDIFDAIKIPSISLEFNNPAPTEKAIIVNSNVDGVLNTSIEEYKTIQATDKNEINIFVDKRPPGSLYAMIISNPHHNGRNSYFYDNIKERQEEFEWNLLYNIQSELKELTIKDYGLDERMKFTSINPDEHKAHLILKDKNGDILASQVISEKFIIEESLQEKIDSIELTFYNLSKADKSINPIIGTKLKNPNENHFSENNIGNINKFYNYIDIIDINTNDKISNYDDFAFVDVVEDNLDLKARARITSRPSDLSYGRNASSSFSVASEEFFNKNLENMKYTVLIDPAHRVEKVMFEKNINAPYNISTTKNGYTKIDFDFQNQYISLNEDNNLRKNLFRVITTPANKSGDDLKIYAFLSSSNEYEIYNQGSGVLEGLDKSQYSYDEDSREIINGEYLSIRKLIGKDDKVGSYIKTKEGDKFFYRFEIDNGTATKRENFDLIDILPFEGDNNNSSYHNTLDVEAARNIKLPEGFTIQFLNQDKFIKIKEDEIIDKLKDENWSNDPAMNTKAVRVTSPLLKPKADLIAIDIPMIAKSNIGILNNGRNNTNKFAYTHNTLGYTQSLSNSVNQSTTIPVPNKDIKLTKISTIMGKKDGVIADVPFVLKSYTGSYIDEQTTDENGVVVFKNIPVSDYIIEEKLVPNGYKNSPVRILVKAEDMYQSKDVYDIGEVKNARFDEFNFTIKNVEVLNDLSATEFDDIKSIYSKNIQSGSFLLTNKDINKSYEFTIENKIGYSLTLNPGDYTLKQTSAPSDNGVNYKHNILEYNFTIDKFGKLLIPKGNGATGESEIEQQNPIVYFPNTIDYKTSNVNILKKSDDGKPLANAEFELFNTLTGESLIQTTNSEGKIALTEVAPGLYNIKEIKAPNGYIKTNQTEVFEVPINESKDFNFEFENKELKVNVNKYKVIASNIIDKKTAEDIASKSISSTNGTFVVIEVLDNIFQVREVWKDNNILIDGSSFSTDINGSIIDIQKEIPLNEDSVLQIENKTKIPGHYEPDKLEEHLSDYVIREDFDGTINIDIEVKPIKGSIYVSKYVIDENDKIQRKDAVIGSRYALHVDKGNGYELLEESTISSSNYTVFKDLNPTYKYRVVEVFVPDGQEDSEVKEYDVELNDFNKYTATVIFRNRIPADDSFVSLNKIDGTTGRKLSDVEFTIIDKHGVSQKLETDSNGQIVFEDLKYDLAPFTIKETKAKDGYRLNSKDIIVTEEDLDNNTVFTVENYKSTEAPETGTFGKLPFVVSSLFLIVVAYALRKRNEE